MATEIIPQDFKDFLKLLNKNKVEYLLIGGYAVGYYGYPRATADMDIWIDSEKEKNIHNLAIVLKKFGLHNVDENKLFENKDEMLRIGYPPLRLEILSKISGVSFDDCYKNRKVVTFGGIKINIISLNDLKRNKKASGRHKDLNDLENIP